MLRYWDIYDFDYIATSDKQTVEDKKIILEISFNSDRIHVVGDKKEVKVYVLGKITRKL